MRTPLLRSICLLPAAGGLCAAAALPLLRLNIPLAGEYPVALYDLLELRAVPEIGVWAYLALLPLALGALTVLALQFAKSITCVVFAAMSAGSMLAADRAAKWMLTSRVSALGTDLFGPSFGETAGELAQNAAHAASAPGVGYLAFTICFLAVALLVLASCFFVSDKKPINKRKTRTRR